jgi:hypothetical protein
MVVVNRSASTARILDQNAREREVLSVAVSNELGAGCRIAEILAGVGAQMSALSPANGSSTRVRMWQMVQDPDEWADESGRSLQEISRTLAQSIDA